MTEKKKKNYYLSASSEIEMNEWMEALNRASQIIPTAEDLLKAGKYKIVDLHLQQMLKQKP